MCPQIMSIQLPFHQLFQRKIITKHQDYTNTYAELYSFDYLSAFLVKLKASILLSVSSKSFHRHQDTFQYFESVTC